MRIRYGFVSNSSSCSFIIPTSLYDINIKVCYALLKSALKNYIYAIECDKEIDFIIEKYRNYIECDKKNGYEPSTYVNTMYNLFTTIKNSSDRNIVNKLLTNEIIDNIFEICSKDYHNITNDEYNNFNEQKNYINTCFYHKDNYTDFSEEELIDIYNIDVFRKSITDDDIIITPRFEDNDNSDLMVITSNILNSTGIRLS